MAADSTDSDKFLFNLGAVYKLTDAQQIYANFSQGYSYPDVQRVLRDVAAYTLTTSGIAPITVNSYELGWRLNQDEGLNLGLTGFYNTSDKVAQFNSDHSVNIVDTDQRVYGTEVNISYPFMETVFAQQAAVTNANPLLAIPAEGRTFALSYTINY